MRQPSRTHHHIYPGPESVQMLIAQGDPPICPSRHPRQPGPPPQHPREAKRLQGRRGRMATQRHQRPRHLRRRHGTLPPSPGPSIPPDGHARPNHHHRRHERRPHPGGTRRAGHTLRTMRSLKRAKCWDLWTGRLTSEANHPTTTSKQRAPPPASLYAMATPPASSGRRPHTAPSRLDPRAIGPCISASQSPTFPPAPQRTQTKAYHPP